MKIGDVSRRRRLADPARLRWYAHHRSVRFSRRMMRTSVVVVVASMRPGREIAARAWDQLQQGSDTRIKPPKLGIDPDKSELSVTFEGVNPFTLSAEMLRVMSPSAEVQGHSPEQRVTVAKKKNVKIKELRPVGNYAVRIVFDDGHDTGLFAWSYLQQLNAERDTRWAEYLSSLAQKGLSRG